MLRIVTMNYPCKFRFEHYIHEFVENMKFAYLEIYVTHCYHEISL
jgi:hypothetical protein